jgi:hypothetical protein
MVLGPSLTLIAFKSGKPSLKFDLRCIVLLQLGALLYGGMIVYQQRPAFVVFGVDRFTTIPAAEVDFDRIKYPELKRIAGIGLRLAQARPPADPKLRQDVIDLFRFPDGVRVLPEAEDRLWVEPPQYEEQQVMRYVTSVERIGIKKGLQQGLQQGEIRVLRRLLTRRFGELPVWVEPRLPEAPPEAPPSHHLQ